MLQNNQKLNIFITFSDSDKEQLEELCKFLTVLKNEDLIQDFWHRGLIFPGQELMAISENNYNNSTLIIALMSSDFLSETDKWAYIFENPDNIRKIIMPVICRYCPWENTPFSKLAVFPQNLSPLNSKRWTTPEEPYMQLVNIIKELLIPPSAKNTDPSTKKINSNLIYKILTLLKNYFHIQNMPYLTQKYGQMIENMLAYIILLCIILVTIGSVQFFSSEEKPILTLLSVTALLFMAITLMANKKLIYRYIAPLVVIIIHTLKPIYDFMLSFWRAITGGR